MKLNQKGFGAVAPILAVVVLVLGFMIYNFLNQSSLKAKAEDNRAYLESLVLIESAEIEYFAAPDGDVLTARSSPARATITGLNGSVGDAYEALSSNLKDQGYKLPGKFIPGGSRSSAVGNLETIATDGEHNLEIRLRLAEELDCRELDERTQNYPNCPDNVIQEFDVLDIDIERIWITYDPDDTGDARPIFLTSELGEEFWSN